MGAMLTVCMRVTEQENGALLPLAFQGVLYLDIFGWVKSLRAKKHDEAEETVPLVQEETEDILETEQASERRTIRGRAKGESDVAVFAGEYLSDAEESEDDHDEETSTDRSIRRPPTSTGVVYSAAGRPQPTRPEESRARGSQDDLRNIRGAPNPATRMSAVENPGG